MRVASVTVFDKDMVPGRGKGKATGGDDLVKSPGKSKDPKRAPRPEKQNHRTEESKTRQSDELKKTVLKKSSVKVLEAHLARITKAAPNPAQDPLEAKDSQFRQETLSDLDQWLIDMNQGRQDFEDEFGPWGGSSVTGSRNDTFDSIQTPGEGPVCPEHHIPRGKFKFPNGQTSWCCPECNPQYVGKPGYYPPSR